MDNQALRFTQSIATSNSFLPQSIHGLQLDKYDHQSFKKGEIIFLPEQESNKVYFLIEGKVKLGTYLNSGREITKSILNKGEIFGELSLMGVTRHTHYAKAWKDTTLCAINIDEVRKIMSNNHQLTFFLMKRIADKLLKKEQQLESLVFKNSRTRIIEFLIDLAKNNGIQVGYERLINNFMTHQEIGDMTATSRQTVTTTLNELRTNNLLIFNRKRMLIRDMDNLAAAV